MFKSSPLNGREYDLLTVIYRNKKRKHEAWSDHQLWKHSILLWLHSYDSIQQFWIIHVIYGLRTAVFGTGTLLTHRDSMAGSGRNNLLLIPHSEVLFCNYRPATHCDAFHDLLLPSLWFVIHDDWFIWTSFAALVSRRPLPSTVRREPCGEAPFG